MKYEFIKFLQIQFFLTDLFNIFSDYSKTLEPVMTCVENLGIKPPDKNRINGKKSF